VRKQQGNLSSNVPMIPGDIGKLKVGEKETIYGGRCGSTMVESDTTVENLLTKVFQREDEPKKSVGPELMVTQISEMG
ncbi:unnamed protein product, partial [Ilex paraguariensis]